MAILKDAAASLGNFMLQFAGQSALNGGYGRGGLGSYILSLSDDLIVDDPTYIDSNNSIVGIAYEFIARKFIEATVTVQAADADGEWVAQPSHPLAALLMNPNPLMGTAKLMASTAIDLARGNAYWVYGRSATDKVVQIYWIPKQFMQPFVRPDDPSGALTAYRCEINGRVRIFDVRDVVHFQGLVSDPDNVYLGRDPLGPQVSHIRVDNEIGVYTETVMQNCGVIGAMAVVESADVKMSDESAKDFKRKFDGLTKGRKRGNSLVLDAPYKITYPGVTPENMALDTIGDRSEERIPAALGLNAPALKLGAGLEHSSYNNIKEAQRNAFDDGVAPLHSIVADVSTRRLVPEFGGDPAKLRIFFDYSMIPSLQEDRNELHDRVRKDYAAGLISQAVANGILNYPVLPGMEDVYGKQTPDMSAFANAMAEARGAVMPARVRLPELRALPKSSVLSAYDADVVLDAIERAEPETRALMLAKVEGNDD